MLIKRKKLTNVKNVHGISIADVSETTKLTQVEVQKARQEARIIKQEAQNILAESQKKLKNAEAKVNEIIRYAEIEANKIKEKVYHETLQAANQEAELIKDRAKSLLKELFEVKRSTLKEAHNEIIKVALDLTEKIIRYQVSIDTNVLKTQVIEAIKKATSEADRVMVFVNPVDIETLQKDIPDIEKLFPSGIDIVPLTNDSVDPGSCIVETKSGQLDASFLAQLSALRELVTRIEVKEPRVEIEDDIVPSIEASNKDVFGHLEEVVEIQDQLQDFSTIQKEHKEEAELVNRLPLEPVKIEESEGLLKEEEEQRLKDELLGDEPLIRFPEQEEAFSFESKKDTEEIAPSPLQNVLPRDVESKEQLALEEKIEQLNKVEEIEQHEQTKKEPIEDISKKKKLVLGSLPERTQKEAEELDDFEFEEDEEEEKEIKPRNVLKPKKASPTEITKIAREVEQGPEWKDLVQEEDEE